MAVRERGESVSGTRDGYEALCVPTVGCTTGEVDGHDLDVDGVGRPVFCVTLCNSLATTSWTRGFEPIWRPPFVTALMPEDRCHLNVLALDPSTAEPAYVSMASGLNVADGWRNRRESGGVITDVRNDRVVCDGLSVPHSPRGDPDDPNNVWLLDAETGASHAWTLARQIEVVRR